MARSSNFLDPDYLKSILDYDPEEGIFVWKYREGFDPAWNAKFPGRMAGKNSEEMLLSLLTDESLQDIIDCYLKWPNGYHTYSFYDLLDEKLRRNEIY